MVRFIPTFIILSLIPSLTLNHPVTIENVDDVVETTGIEAFNEIVNDTIEISGAQIEDSVYNVIEETEVDVPTNNVNVQAIEAEEITAVQEAPEDIAGVAVDDIEEDIIAGIQGTEDDDVQPNVQAVADDEDEIAGIQGVEDEDENVEVAEATPTSILDENIVVQSLDNQNTNDDDFMNFELFSEIEEGEKITAAAVTKPIAPNSAAIEILAMDTINKLKALHIIRSDSKFQLKSLQHYKNSNINKRKDDSDSDSSSSSDEEDLVNKPDDVPITEAPEVETQAPEAINEVITGIVEEVETIFVPDQNEQPTDFEEVITQSINADDAIPTEIFDYDEKYPLLVKKQVCIDDRCEEEDIVEIALFEVENETDKNDFETVTEIVTEVHLVSYIDDGDQPTIGAIPDDNIDDINDEIPLFGVVEEPDEDEVQIAKREDVFVEINYEIVEVNDQQTPTEEETTESIVISGFLIELGDQDQHSVSSIIESATDAIEEEPIYVN